jgi:hypothetical protein
MRVEKCFFDLNTAMDSMGYYTALEIPYLVFEVESEEAALSAVRGVAAEKVENLGLKSIELAERINQTTFKVTAVYEPLVFDTGDGTSGNSNEPSFNFDTGGGTKHITQSLQTIGKFPASAPDFAGAIEVDNEGNVNGVDVAMPVMNFSETHYFSPDRVSTSYKKRIADLTGKVNSGSFKGYATGEVLFLGASGSRRGKRSTDYWEITFKFAVSPNVTNLKAGTITVASKKGWDYLWVRYADDVSSDRKALIKKPVAAYVEKVYEQAEFGGLGIGS